MFLLMNLLSQNKARIISLDSEDEEMPIFEFACNECGFHFSSLIAYADKDKVKCPECKSGNIKQLLSMFSTGTNNAVNYSSSCNDCSARTRG